MRTFQKNRASRLYEIASAQQSAFLTECFKMRDFIGIFETAVQHHDKHTLPMCAHAVQPLRPVDVRLREGISIVQVLPILDL